MGNTSKIELKLDSGVLYNYLMIDFFTSQKFGQISGFGIIPSITNSGIIPDLHTKIRLKSYRSLYNLVIFLHILLSMVAVLIIIQRSPTLTQLMWDKCKIK